VALLVVLPPPRTMPPVYLRGGWADEGCGVSHGDEQTAEHVRRADLVPRKRAATHKTGPQYQVWLSCRSRSSQLLHAPVNSWEAIFIAAASPAGRRAAAPTATPAQKDRVERG